MKLTQLMIIGFNNCGNFGHCTNNSGGMCFFGIRLEDNRRKNYRLEDMLSDSLNITHLSLCKYSELPNLYAEPRPFRLWPLNGLSKSLPNPISHTPILWIRIMNQLYLLPMSLKCTNKKSHTSVPGLMQQTSIQNLTNSNFEWKYKAAEVLNLCPKENDGIMNIEEGKGKKRSQVSVSLNRLVWDTLNFMWR